MLSTGIEADSSGLGQRGTTFVYAGLGLIRACRPGSCISFLPENSMHFLSLDKQWSASPLSIWTRTVLRACFLPPAQGGREKGHQEVLRLWTGPPPPTPRRWQASSECGVFGWLSACCPASEDLAAASWGPRLSKEQQRQISKAASATDP